ncbi:MAG: hypothetical protein ACREML_02250 [Vulcanimicrobiaceae bacterium]
MKPFGAFCAGIVVNVVLGLILSASILAEPPVALLDENVDRHRTRTVAEAYLKFLYTRPAQEIEAENHYRPRDPQVLAAHARDFPRMKLYTVEQDFGGWQKAQAKYFGDSGIFDQIYVPRH